MEIEDIEYEDVFGDTRRTTDTAGEFAAYMANLEKIQAEEELDKFRAETAWLRDLVNPVITTPEAKDKFNVFNTILNEFLQTAKPDPFVITTRAPTPQEEVRRPHFILKSSAQSTTRIKRV